MIFKNFLFLYFSYKNNCIKKIKKRKKKKKNKENYLYKEQIQKGSTINC